MENTVIQFIITNIWLFLPLGLGGIAITLFLFFTGARETPIEDDFLSADDKTLLGLRINIYALIYFIIWIVLIGIGILSDFLLPTIISGIITFIPLLLLILVKRPALNPRHGD